MAKTITLLDLEALADESIDDIQEAPEYINPPAGDYEVITKSGTIKSFTNEKDEVSQSIQVTLAVAKTLELVSDAEPPVPEESLFTLRFQGTTEGLGMFKRELRKMSGLEKLPAMTLNECFEMLETEMQFNARISYRKFKDKEYLQLRII